MNCGGPLREEGGRVRGRGKSVYHQPGASVDEHSHHKFKKGDFQVSKGVIRCVSKGGKGAKGE